MKKLLLGSTALVVGGLMAALAMVADPIKIGVGGYYTFSTRSPAASSHPRHERHLGPVQGSQLPAGR